MLIENEEKKVKSDFFKDIIMAFIILIISIGCFFTYNPADAPLDIGTDGMTFATYPLAVAGLLTVLGIIYLFSSLKKYKNSSEELNLFSNITYQIKKNKSLYSKRLGSVLLLIIYALMIGKINFLISSILFLFAAFYLYDRRDYIRMGIISFLGSGFLYALFVYFLKLPI